MKKRHKAGRLVLPYLEEELQPGRIPAWLTGLFIVFVLSALLYPFYA